ncbi:chromosome partitioning protein ParB [Mesorhizobium sp. SARCC-RB16n]|uniref:ParB/RepB/Spo0J family partition protein n=1 Tax=Mesorhizobium sp. SARCC-RB16n TaxID=2116687 RepID=UPI00122EFCD1|nr:ParB/RepB/Spo0J family partition protein [Mesorhizobium sp. SARCC-RB16n]KAA3448451.1 chromosome partitioning protein ParB [Mesorhizobium sp. SARCC-RB16n]
MQLAHVSIDQLSVSAINMRHSKRAPDISDILPSVRARGVLVPLLVRPNGTPETFEIVAGRRRYFAAKTVADERGEAEPLPCAIMEEGDDADALEASLIENIARLDPDEVSQWETFTRLIKEGRGVADIAATFGLTEPQVKRILALGDLLPKIREAYRREEIDAETVRHLTMASKAQQKDWLALFADPDHRAPRGFQLKQWLFGGQSISTKVALFSVEDYPGLTVSDLFGEESYFADADLFWQKQNEAIAARRDAYIQAGWREVVVLEPGQYFHSWDYEKTPKKKGGKVVITVSHRGEVDGHEGWLSRKEARRARANGEAGEGAEDAEAPAKPSRPELSGPMQNYVDLHRHAAVRVAMLDHPGAALRVMVAHAIAGSSLWQVRVEPQRAANESVAASIAAGRAEAAFAERRREVWALLGSPDEEGAIAGGNSDDFALASIFARLLALSDDDVQRVLALVMAETLGAGSAMVEALGNHLNVNLGACWQPDDAFFDLLRDREVANALLADIGGKLVADGNSSEKVKTQKTIIRDFLSGENGRQKIDGWLPRWMKVPVESYTDRGGFRTADQWLKVRPLFVAE